MTSSWIGNEDTKDRARAFLINMGGAYIALAQSKSASIASIKTEIYPAM